MRICTFLVIFALASSCGGTPTPSNTAVTRDVAPSVAESGDNLNALAMAMAGGASVVLAITPQRTSSTWTATSASESWQRLSKDFAYGNPLWQVATGSPQDGYDSSRPVLMTLMGHTPPLGVIAPGDGIVPRVRSAVFPVSDSGPFMSALEKTLEISLGVGAEDGASTCGDSCKLFRSDKSGVQWVAVFPRDTVVVVVAVNFPFGSDGKHDETLRAALRHTVSAIDAAKRLRATPATTAALSARSPLAIYAVQAGLAETAASFFLTAPYHNAGASEALSVWRDTMKEGDRVWKFMSDATPEAEDVAVLFGRDGADHFELISSLTASGIKLRGEEKNDRSAPVPALVFERPLIDVTFRGGLFESLKAASAPDGWKSLDHASFSEALMNCGFTCYPFLYLRPWGLARWATDTTQSVPLASIAQVTGGRLVVTEWTRKRLAGAIALVLSDDDAANAIAAQFESLANTKAHVVSNAPAPTVIVSFGTDPGTVFSPTADPEAHHGPWSATIGRNALAAIASQRPPRKATDPAPLYMRSRQTRAATVVEVSTAPLSTPSSLEWIATADFRPYAATGDSDTAKGCVAKLEAMPWQKLLSHLDQPGASIDQLTRAVESATKLASCATEESASNTRVKRLAARARTLLGIAQGQRRDLVQARSDLRAACANGSSFACYTATQLPKKVLPIEVLPALPFPTELFSAPGDGVLVVVEEKGVYVDGKMACEIKSRTLAKPKCLGAAIAAAAGTAQGFGWHWKYDEQGKSVAVEIPAEWSGTQAAALLASMAGQKKVVGVVASKASGGIGYLLVSIEGLAEDGEQDDDFLGCSGMASKKQGKFHLKLGDGRDRQATTISSSKNALAAVYSWFVDHGDFEYGCSLTLGVTQANWGEHIQLAAVLRHKRAGALSNSAKLNKSTVIKSTDDISGDLEPEDLFEWINLVR